MIDLKTRAVAPFFPDARAFRNIYKLQKHVLLRHQSHLIVFMGNKNLRFWLYFTFIRRGCDRMISNINITNLVCTTARVDDTLGDQ